MRKLRERAANLLDDFATALVEASTNPDVKSPLLNDETRGQVVQAASLAKSRASAMRETPQRENVAEELQ